MSTYVERREKFIAEFLNNVEIEYRKSAQFRELMDRAVELTVALEVAACDEKSAEFVNDLLGFMYYASMKSVARSAVLTTIYHDLAEFQENRHEAWFCPRSSGYMKYLSGVSGLVP